MSRRKTRRLLSPSALAALAGAVAIVFDRSARAATELDDVSDSQYIALSAQSQYAPAGCVVVVAPSGDGIASGTLIAPDWVLTSAHDANVAPAADLSFGQGASVTPGQPAANSVANVVIDPGYTGDATQGFDLALMQLSTPITNVAPAVIYPGAAGSEIGMTSTVIGYGFTGTGLTGVDTSVPDGIRRGYQNVLDAVGGQSTIGGPPECNTYSFAGFSSNLMLSDFDQPNNPSVSLMGNTSPLPLEGCSVYGDSGGGAYVTVNGQTYLAGVTDFVGYFSNNPYSTSGVGYYGDFTGYTRLSVPDSQNFLLSVLATASSWNSSAGGTWASLTNWTKSDIPEFMQAAANFGSAIQQSSTITLDAAWTVGTVTFNNTNSYTLLPGTAGSLTLNNGAASAAITDMAGNHFLNVPLAFTSNVVATVVRPGDVLTFGGPISGQGGLTVSGAGTVRLAMNSGTTKLSSLTINSGATLDIANNTLLINYGLPADDPVAAVTAALSSAYAGGRWTGTGITSSTAAGGGLTPLLSVGYADGNVDFNTPAGPNQILVKYTLAGDANLDGQVNFADLLIVAQRFNTTGNDWAGGNFIYSSNGLVNFADLLIVAQNFNQILNPAGSSSEQIGGGFLPLAQPSAVKVPEPGGTALAAAAAIGYMAKRRRKTIRLADSELCIMGR
jgi:hypothetical protein